MKHRIVYFNLKHPFFGGEGFILRQTTHLECCYMSQAGRTEGVSEQLIDSDARALYEAGEGRKGTDCAVFIDILTTRSALHLRKGKLAYSPPGLYFFTFCPVRYITFLVFHFSYSSIWKVLKVQQSGCGQSYWHGDERRHRELSQSRR